MNHHGQDRWCIHSRHMAPSEGFRPLPGLRARREVCADCYEKVMTARKRVKTVTFGDVPADRVPF